MDASRPDPMEEQRYLRHLDLLNPFTVATPINLIGAGGIGSHVGLMLAKMGLGFAVYDPDTIELHNLSNQVYPNDWLGKSKAEALAALCQAQGDVLVAGFVEAFTNQLLDGIVISAVDSLDARRTIWRGVQYDRQQIDLYVDARMGGEVVSIFAVDPNDDAQVAQYEQTIAPNVQADPDPCTARAIAYNLFTCAGWVGKIVQAKLRNLLYPNEVYIDLAKFQHLSGYWKVAQRPVAAVA